MLLRPPVTSNLNPCKVGTKNLQLGTKNRIFKRLPETDRRLASGFSESIELAFIKTLDSINVLIKQFLNKKQKREINSLK